MSVKVRMLYDNYHLDEQYPEEEIREQLVETGVAATKEEVTDTMIQSVQNDLDAENWDELKQSLLDYFDDNLVLFTGELGRWNGTYPVGRIGQFPRMFQDALSDGNYVQIFDQNGHLFLRCFHHDGTNLFEIKLVTQRGKEYYENWEYGTRADNRTQAAVMNRIKTRYSRLPNYAHQIWGCPKREYDREEV